MKKVFKNNRIIVGLCGVLLAAGVCIGTNHYMISDSAGSVAAESQKTDPLTRHAAAAEQDFDILEEEQESDNSPGWHTETQGSKTYKYYNNSAGNRLKGYRKIKKYYYFFSQKSGYAVCNGWKYVRIKGKKYKLYFDKKGRRSDPTKKLGSKARYQIRVSLRDNMVTIYAKDGAKGFIIPVKAMVCSVGMSGHTTRKGTYSLSRSGRWHVLRYNSNGQYATRYSGPYMFHSVTYDRLGNHYSLQAAEYRKLGKAASHGCIRLQVEDAKWIYDHAPQSTTTIRDKFSKVSRQFAFFWTKFIFLVLFLDKSCIMVAMAEKGPLQGQRANA